MIETIFKSPGIEIKVEETKTGCDYTVDINHGKSGYYSGGNNFPTKSKAIKAAIRLVKWRIKYFPETEGIKEFEEFCKEQEKI